MSRNKPIRKEFDINIIRDQKFVDLVINNDGYLSTIRHIENNILISPVKELYIKEQIRRIKENYPERSSDPQKVSKDLDVISVIERRGYFAFINFPQFTIGPYVERINLIYKKDLIKAGEITHPYLNFENETFTKLSKRKRFDFLVCLLFQGGLAAALEGYLNKKLAEISRGGGNADWSILGEKDKPSNLTYLLKLYYEKGCKELNKQQVKKLAEENNLSQNSLKKIWERLKTDYYKPKAKRQSAKEFLKSYAYLMESFKNNDLKALEAVENHFNQLKETYPDLTF